MESANIKVVKYDFIDAGGEYNSYFFKTESGIIYEVKFKEFFYLFKENYDSYEFAIEVANNPIIGRPPLDYRLPITIAAIFTDFFDKIEQPSVVYICDSSDSKQLARQRKFNSWFYEFKQPNFFKIEGKLVDKNGEVIPSSLILKSSNPYFSQIIEEFRKIVEGYNVK